MVTWQELRSFLEKTAPPELAESYDNVGLLIEGESTEIKKVLLALDVSEYTVEQAETVGADLIISHHPLLFQPIRCLTKQTGSERAIRSLLQKGIGLYAMHTNFDSAGEGLCDAFLDNFGSFSVRSSFSGEAAGIGRIGKLKAPCNLLEVLETARQNFGNIAISYVGDPLMRVDTVAVCNGGGGDLLYDAYKLGAQVYVSGDFKHHHARFAAENNVGLINISHYDAEIGFSFLLEKKLIDKFGERLQVICSYEQNPWKEF
ncbi:MAG: Nif3-like dinuclear metal center hexameric protein [Ruminococcaceae bacterium]|nr:Nif3-like dinuclear metal center hexameric protein [Oscillospiraceae bacterium]